MRLAPLIFYLGGSWGCWGGFGWRQECLGVGSFAGLGEVYTQWGSLGVWYLLHQPTYHISCTNLLTKGQANHCLTERTPPANCRDQQISQQNSRDQQMSRQPKPKLLLLFKRNPVSCQLTRQPSSMWDHGCHRRRCPSSCRSKAEAQRTDMRSLCVA